ncbi:hypothetical protein BJV74DRAFT_881054 [Russula compacta]|nr:hypothetical protein BJV74DRAFT_881054 [Russula compacta]
MEYPSSSASQPIPSVALGAVPNKLTELSSQEAIPSSQSQASFNNKTGLLGLKLPPKALKIIAQCKASGRFPALLDHVLAKKTQPSPSHGAKSIATARRPTARWGSQPNRLKFGHMSAYARVGGVPVAKPVPQPLDAAYYQPPPVKARVRRVALAARSKARATATPMVIDGPESPLTSIPSSSILAATASLPATQPGAGAAPTALSQYMVTLSTDSTRPAPTVFWGGRINGPSIPALKAGPSSNLERAKEISRIPGLGGIPIKLIQRLLPRIEKRRNSRAEGDAGISGTGGSGSCQSTADENLLPPVMEAITTEGPKLPHTAWIPESIPPADSVNRFLLWGKRNRG